MKGKSAQMTLERGKGKDTSNNIFYVICLNLTLSHPNLVYRRENPQPEAGLPVIKRDSSP